MRPPIVSFARAALSGVFLVSSLGGVPSSVHAAGVAAAPHGTLDVTSTTLSNGLRIVVLPDKLAPAVTTWLNIEAGSDDESYEGLAHAQEHMFYRGSATLSGAQADEIAGFTGDEDNADTQSAITQYFHTVPSQDLDLALQLDASRFTGILDAQRDWSEERGAIEQEVTRDNSDATYRLGEKLQRHLMAGTPYADPGLGTLASFDHQINSPQLRDFYARWYHPNNAIYVIAGDVDAATAIASVRRYFGALPKATLPARSQVRFAAPTPATFTDTSDQGSTTAIVAYRYPGFSDRDYAASVLLVDALNSQRGALYGLVASGKALDIETDPNQFPQGGFATITAHVPTTTQPKAALAAIESVIDAYRKTGIPPTLVAAAKQREIAQVATAADSIKGLAAQWSETLAVEGRTPDDDLAAIERTTPDDVNRVLRTWFVNRTASTAYAVPKNGAAGGDDASAGGGETRAQSTKVEPLPPWAKRALDRLEPPAPTTLPTLFRLANGLHVIVRPDTTSAAVIVEGIVRHDPGIEEPAHQSGVGDVVEALMPYGTTSYGRIAYQAQLDAIAATVKTGFGFSLTTLASHFDRGMQLLADDELHPLLGAADFAIVRDSRASALAGEATTPDHLAQVALADRLYPEGDPARRFASPDDVKALTLDDAKTYYSKAFRPDLTTIAIVGNVTPAAARASVERWFGGWTAAGPTPDLARHATRDNASSALVIPATGRIQDTAILRETLALGNRDPDFAPLEIADTLLSGDFSSILIRDMRVTTGYVYAVGTSVRADRERSTFNVQYACSPANFSKAQRTLERDLSALGRSNVTAERLQRAKSRLLSELALAGVSYDSLASELAGNASAGLSLDESYRRAQREFAASADSVRTAVSRWIRPKGFVRVVEGPTPK